MNTRHLPSGHVLVWVLWIILAGGLLASLAIHLWPRRSPSKRIDEKATISLLRSEAMSFLVTRRAVVQIVVEHAESDWLGDWHGVLWATVHIHHGADLQQMDEGNVRREGDRLIVRLPDPELLDLSVEPGSVGFLSKSTVVPKLQDLLRDGQRQRLERRLREEAMKFARRHDLLPSRQQVVQQLNDAAARLKEASGVELRFE